MSDVRDNEVVFARGDGCHLFDTAGRAYLDATASLWYCNVGHGRAEVAEAIGRQAATLASCSSFDVYTSDTTLELADRLSSMAPVDDAVVFLTCGGSDSIDTAAKLARLYWSEVGRPEKRYILARDGAYHGMNAYGTALAGISVNRSHFDDLIDEIVFVPAMDSGGLAAAIDRIGPERVAAFFAEPVIGGGGVYPPENDYLLEAAEVCSSRGTLFIADEVISGFGRTGHWFASERYGIRPDMLVLAKGITSGYVPLGAVVISGRLAEPFWRPGGDAWLRHGYTYSGHATACAAALANLDILERDGLVARVDELQHVFADILAGLSGVSGVREVRTVGLLGAVALVDRDGAVDVGFSRRVAEQARNLGVLTRTLAGGELQLSPPFVIEPAQIVRVAETLVHAIEQVQAADLLPR
jgi:adenosylmethionine-8-amino-7-oxononanoate aminotransferase